MVSTVHQWGTIQIRTKHSHNNIRYEHEINERGLILMWTDLEDTLLVAKDMVQKKVNIS